MKLLDEIIELASGGDSSVTTLLRKCLVLAYALHNDQLKVWAENELNGYEEQGDVPEYRKTPAVAKGYFIGPFGRQINDQPLPSVILEEKHRHFAESAVLSQPIAAYEGIQKGQHPAFEWPPNLTARYQSEFIQGYSLNRAWQEIPSSFLVGLIDTIKTRVLRLALELRDELGAVNDNVGELSREKVDRSVVNYIFGGTNVIASSDFTQIQSLEIAQGDWASLEHALHTLGIKRSEIESLRGAIAEDSKDPTHSGVGTRTGAWLKEIGDKLGVAGLEIGVNLVKAQITKWISVYLGLPLQ